MATDSHFSQTTGKYHQATSCCYYTITTPTPCQCDWASSSITNRITLEPISSSSDEILHSVSSFSQVYEELAHHHGTTRAAIGYTSACDTTEWACNIQ